MLILSQNKMYLVNTETNTDIYIAHNGKDVRTEDCLIGQYKDIEECKEVIALIYQAYAKGYNAFQMPPSEVSE